MLALLYGVRNAGIEKTDVEYVIDCAEEACGDMNQRGGGNFAKAAAEVAGLLNATGSDSRGFCAGPSHALIEAAASRKIRRIQMCSCNSWWLYSKTWYER